MKDPWCTTPDVFEILSLPVTATAPEINQAFGSALARGVPAAVAMRARTTLLREDERAVAALLRIPEEDIEALGFASIGNILESPSSRKKLIAALIAQERTQPSLIHVVAALNYWTAKCGSTVTTELDKSAWGIAISHFVYLMYDEEFLERIATQAPKQAIEKVLSKIREDLETRVKVAEQQRNVELAGFYRSLLAALEFEVLTAKRIEDLPGAIGVSRAYDQLVCGSLFLKLHGWCEFVQSQISSLNLDDFDALSSTSLKNLSSPFAIVEAPLTQGNLAEAERLIIDLSRTYSLDSVAKAIVGQVQVQRGRERLLVGELEAAIVCWEKAEKYLRPDQLQTPEMVTLVDTQVRQALVRIGKQKKTLEMSTLLRRLVKIFPTDDIKALLAQNLRTETDDIFNAVLEALRTPGGLSDNEIANQRLRLIKGVDILREAAELDSSLAERLKVAQQLETEWPNILDSNYCWYCRWRPADAASAVKHAMHRVTEHTYAGIRYQKIELTIPRCKNCHSLHVRHKTLIVGLAVASFIGACIAANLVDDNQVIAFAVVGLAMWFGLRQLLLRNLGTKPEKFLRSSSAYAYAVQEGYVDGKEPRR